MAVLISAAASKYDLGPLIKVIDYHIPATSSPLRAVKGTTKKKKLTETVNRAQWQLYAGWLVIQIGRGTRTHDDVSDIWPDQRALCLFASSGDTAGRFLPSFLHSYTFSSVSFRPYYWFPLQGFVLSIVTVVVRYSLLCLLSHRKLWKTSTPSSLPLRDSRSSK